MRPERTVVMAVIALALIASRAMAGVCDVVYTLDSTPRTVDDGAVLVFRPSFCDTTGKGGNVNGATFGVDRTVFVPWSGAWTVCPTGGCTSDPPDGQMHLGGFAVAPSSCVEFELRLTLQLGNRGKTICEQGQALVKSNNPPTSGFSCPKSSDDPTTPAGGDPTCVTVRDPAPGCAVSAVIEPPSVDVCTGTQVNFSAESSSASGCSGPLSYQWQRDGADIPGATAPTFDIPASAPPSAGQIRVRVSCASTPACVGLSAPSQTNIYAPQATLNVPASACVGQTITAFVDSAQTCSIDCGNGTPPVSRCYATCTYLAGGSYTVRASFDDGTCQSTVSQAVSVIASPTACSDTPATVCEDPSGRATAITLGNCSVTGLLYAWSSTLGSLSDPAAESPVLTLPDVATATVVTVTLTASAPGGCGTPDTIARSFTLEPAPDLTAGAAPSPACSGASVAFTGLASGSPGPFTYLWEFGDGGRATSASAAHVYASAGSYTATLTATDSGTGCPGTRSFTVEVLGATTVVAAANPSATCPGKDIAFTSTPSGSPGPFTYSWDFGDSRTSSQQNPSHAYTAVGSYNVTLAVTDLGTGCRTVNSLPIDIGSSCCAAVIPAVPDLRASKQPTRADVTLVWGAVPEATDGYDVWAVGAKNDIPRARLPGGPGIRPVCQPASSSSCVDPGAVPGPAGTRAFYAVLGVCGGSEGL